MQPQFKYIPILNGGKQGVAQWYVSSDAPENANSRLLVKVVRIMTSCLKGDIPLACL